MQRLKVESELQISLAVAVWLQTRQPGGGFDRKKPL